MQNVRVTVDEVINIPAPEVALLNETVTWERANSE
jgi:hypothetical protein